SALAHVVAARPPGPRTGRSAVKRAAAVVPNGPAIVVAVGCVACHRHARRAPPANVVRSTGPPRGTVAATCQSAAATVPHGPAVMIPAQGRAAQGATDVHAPLADLVGSAGPAQGTVVPAHKRPTAIVP